MTQISTQVGDAASLLKQGGIVAIPTETVYGLAANAFDLDAVSSIFTAKNRPFYDPLIIHCATKQKAFRLLIDFPYVFNQLADAFWPGPLTLVALKSSKVPDMITAGSDKVAVRVPNHKLTLELLDALPFPLAAPSANPFGYVSPTSAQHVYSSLKGSIPLILDGGVCEVGIESTIVGMNANFEPEIWRLGGISQKEIEAVCGCKVALKIQSSSNPKAPGQLQKHYSPSTKLRIVTLDQLIHMLKENKPNMNEVGLISFGLHPVFTQFKYHFALSEKGKIKDAAHNLYHVLREADSCNLAEIWTILPPDKGVGKAIQDRLKRAAYAPESGNTVL